MILNLKVPHRSLTFCQHIEQVLLSLELMKKHMKGLHIVSSEYAHLLCLIFSVVLIIEKTFSVQAAQLQKTVHQIVFSPAHAATD